MEIGRYRYLFNIIMKIHQQFWRKKQNYSSLVDNEACFSTIYGKLRNYIVVIKVCIFYCLAWHLQYLIRSILRIMDSKQNRIRVKNREKYLGLIFRIPYWGKVCKGDCNPKFNIRPKNSLVVKCQPTPHYDLGTFTLYSEPIHFTYYE